MQLLIAPLVHGHPQSHHRERVRWRGTPGHGYYVHLAPSGKVDHSNGRPRGELSLESEVLRSVRLVSRPVRGVFCAKGCTTAYCHRRLCCRVGYRPCQRERQTLSLPSVRSKFSQSPDPETARTIREINIATLRTSVKLFDRLDLQPADARQEESAHNVPSLFIRYSAFLLKLLRQFDPAVSL